MMISFYYIHKDSSNHRIEHAHKKRKKTPLTQLTMMTFVGLLNEEQEVQQKEKWSKGSTNIVLSIHARLCNFIIYIFFFKLLFL